MSHVTLVGIAASALATSALVLVGTAAAAPTGPSEVDDTVQTLKASGYTVIVNRTGAGPLSNCSVTAVRPGVTHQIMDTRGSDIKPLIISDTVYVDVAC
ncbi:hypothetical protein H7J93_14075 [Mycobacterium barrassiae]|uniref:hypothetical protein n=1 Tax=Mycobacterium barrassiae TaxID=319709 RepID=UPI0022658BE8|nr:hypothetical protein [Mycobacterium barrassiae]MCV7300758.1 hypothetical protein [Mycobacterium barrassiae]